MKKAKISDDFRHLREDLKPMTFPKKVDHLWTYYKEYAFTVLMVIVLIVAVISCISNLGRKLYLSGELCNVSISQEGHDYLIDGVREKYNAPEKEDVQLVSVQFATPQVMSQVDTSYQAAMGMVGQVEAKNLDYVFMDQEALDFFAGQEMFLNLETFLTPEEQEIWKDKLIRVRFEDSDVTESLALDVTDMPFVRDCVRCDGKVYLALAGNLPRPESTHQFWEHINSWEERK